MSSGKDCPRNVCQPLIFDGRKRRIGREKYKASVLQRSEAVWARLTISYIQRGCFTYLEAVLANAALNPAVRAS